MSTASDMPNPVIVVPGITATDMQDDYSLPPEKVWTTIWPRKHDRLALYPSPPSSEFDRLYELREPALIRSGGPFPLVYREMVEELREELDPTDKIRTPVYPFSYDWRQPLEVTARTLREFISEVIRRTKLMLVYRKSQWPDDPKVNLVGHSMGGLVIAGALTSKKEPVHEVAKLVDKIATIGTPWHGSCDAVTKIVTGGGALGNNSQGSRERRTARLTPSLYYLLPSYENAVHGISDIFNGKGWQEGVSKQLGEAIVEVEGDKGYSCNLARGKKRLDKYLNNAKEYRERIAQWKVDEEKILIIAGIGEKTLISVHVVDGEEAGKSRFLFHDEDNKHIGDGDGTVPSKSSIPPFVDQIKPPVVCVSREDLSFLGDTPEQMFAMLAGFHESIPGMRSIPGMHAFMPKMNLVLRLLVRFLSNQDDTHNNTWGRRHPDVKGWNLPFRLEQRDRDR